MYRYITNVLFIGLMVGVMACGNNGTGPDPAEAPSFPEIENMRVEPDLSFFEDNQAKFSALSKSAENNFSEASSVALGASYYFALGQTYGSFLSMGENEDAEYHDGVWVWNYSSTMDGTTVEMKVTAEEQDDAVRWAMYWSYDDGEGNSYEDYKILEGTVANDQSYGEWLFNSLDADTNQEVPFIKSNWHVTSETEKDVSVEYYSSGSIYMLAEYRENAPEYSISFTYYNGSDDVTVSWNEETKEGYIIQGSTKSCWDQNFADTTCS